MQITADVTVNEVIDRFPAAMPLLDRYGIDLCCGGGDRLEEAAQRAGADLTALLNDLRALAGKGA